MFSLSTFGERDFYFQTPMPSIAPDTRPPYDRINNATSEAVGVLTCSGKLHACLPASCLRGLTMLRRAILARSLVARVCRMPSIETTLARYAGAVQVL